MSRIEVDRERCVGSGTCEALAPEVLVVHRPQPAGDELDDVEDAVQACPTRALALGE